MPDLPLSKVLSRLAICLASLARTRSRDEKRTVSKQDANGAAVRGGSARRSDANRGGPAASRGLVVSVERRPRDPRVPPLTTDRKSTRLNSSHGYISYAVFCLKK